MKPVIQAVQCPCSTIQFRRIALAMAFAIASPQPGLAQQQQPAPMTPPAAPPAAGTAPAPGQQQFQQSAEWGKLPRMQLERQFAGPLQDTVVQRWRDPVD